MTYYLEPYVGFGQVKLGMSSEEICRIMGEKPKRFKKCGTVDADQFSEFFVYYKEGGKSDAIEFFEPADVVYRDIRPFNCNVKKLERFFADLDPAMIYDAGFISKKVGIGFYIPFIGDEDATVESVIIFVRGSYDGLAI